VPKEFSIKFRTFQGKIPLLREYAFAIWQNVVELGGVVTEEEIGDLLLAHLGTGDQTLEVKYDGELRVEVGDLWPQDLKRLDRGVKVQDLENAFWVRGNQLYYKRENLKAVLSFYVVRLAAEILAVHEVEEELLEFDEAFLVSDVEGIVAIRKIGTKELGNLRFWSRKIRNDLMRKWR